jgi:hypothetical protein
VYFISKFFFIDFKDAYVDTLVGIMRTTKVRTRDVPTEKDGAVRNTGLDRIEVSIYKTKNDVKKLFFVY